MELVQNTQKTPNVTKDLKQINFDIKLQRLTEYAKKILTPTLSAIIPVRQEIMHSCILHNKLGAFSFCRIQVLQRLPSRTDNLSNVKL